MLRRSRLELYLLRLQDFSNPKIRLRLFELHFIGAFRSEPDALYHAHITAMQA